MPTTGDTGRCGREYSWAVNVTVLLVDAAQGGSTWDVRGWCLAQEGYHQHQQPSRQVEQCQYQLFWKLYVIVSICPH